MHSRAVPTLFRSLVVAVALLARPVAATTIVVPTDEQLIRKSPLIVTATVARSTAVVRGGGVWTETVLTRNEVLKGDAPAEMIVREVGGHVDDRATVIFGAPRYNAGERVLVFLTPTPRGDYQTVDLFIGKFTERTTRDGERIWYREEASDGTRLLDRAFHALAATNVQRDAARFERFIRAAVHDAAPVPDYGVANPSFRDIDANFTLLVDPTIYRWFAFDSNTSISWRSVGTQSGYNGGGVTELQAAMSAWTSYTAANIRYAYAGSSSASPGGLDRVNGINEVVFGDPLAEIAGTWDPSAGGVVGVGGFNNVANGPPWKSPFTADASHPAQQFDVTYNILEGNLVVQDGVSPANGVSSATLAEIVAHEFGHTLGFGHSSDATALMYYRVTGGGAGLRTDDQVAARWLYPSNGTGGGGGGGITVPAAPSSLTATLSGTSAQLQWSDNATNETRQTIYVAQGSGSFVRLTDVGANQTTYSAPSLAAGQTFAFRVTASNAAGESAPSNAVSVVVPGNTLQAAFAVTPVNGVAGRTTFKFTDRSTGPVTRWRWDFGDGSTNSTQQNATYIYPNPGTYTVSLTVYTATGQQSTAMRTTVVTAPDAPVNAAFSFSPANPSVIDTLTFTDESTGPVSSWAWTFGDETSSSDASPSHRYASSGTYTVKLVVSGNGSSASASKTIVVGSGSGGSANVDADFEASPATPVAGTVVTFRDTSTGVPNSWYWQFGDGFSSTLQNPTHAFAKSGTYNVTMTAGNTGSSSAKTKTINVVSTQQLFRSIVPVAAETIGSGGFSWRTELTLFNAGNESVNVTAKYLPTSGENGEMKTFAVAKGSSVVFANALHDLFAVESGAGAITFESLGATTAPQLKVASRTFTNSATGTYGQFVPDAPGGRVAATTYITALASNAAFRTNIGLVNASSNAQNVTLTLFGANGSQVAVANVSVPAASFQQSGLTALFPAATASYDVLSLRISAPVADAIFAYASVVDNRTQDPIYLGAMPRPGSTQLVIPAVARAAGASGTFWRSDVTLFNAGSDSSTYELTFLRSGSDNVTTNATKNVSLPAGATTTINDVTTFIGSGDSSGALLITSTSASSSPVVTSRTYTDRVSDGGTYGQSIDAISTFAPEMTVTGLHSDGGYRTNIGFVNSSTAPLTITARLMLADGTLVKESPITLAARSQIQLATAQLFGVDTANLGTFTVSAHAPTANLFLYASVVDNASGDPVFISGR